MSLGSNLTYLIISFAIRELRMVRVPILKRSLAKAIMTGTA